MAIVTTNSGETITTDDVKKIIVDGEYKTLVEKAEALGKYLGKELDKNKRLTTAQVRKIYGEVKRLQMKPYESVKDRVTMLLPKLAYAAGRPDAREGIKELEKVLSGAIVNINGSDSFGRFVDFFEAILAYHKKYGGD